MKPSHSADGAFKPIHVAKTKTEAVKEELTVAGAELHLANTALDRSLPPAQKTGDVRKALDQNETVEDARYLDMVARGVLWFASITRQSCSL